MERMTMTAYVEYPIMIISMQSNEVFMTRGLMSGFPCTFRLRTKAKMPKTMTPMMKLLHQYP